MVFSPAVYTLAAIASFVAFIGLSKSLILHHSLGIIVFFWIIFLAIFEFRPILKAPKTNLQKDMLPIQALLAFGHCAFYYCFFGALATLPTLSFTSLFLTFPLYIPWILKLWMGKKINLVSIFIILIAWIGTLLSFCYGLGNLAILTVIFAAILKALLWVGYKRFEISNSLLTIWLVKYSISISTAALLLIGQWEPLKLLTILFIVLIAFLGQASAQILKKAVNYDKSLKTIYLFNLCPFFCIALDYFVFHTQIYLNSLLSVSLIYFSLFLIFYQKKVLPNFTYNL